MNKLVRFFLVVLGFTSFSVSAVPEPLRRMWDRLTCRSVDVVERVDHRGARSSRPAGGSPTVVMRDNPSYAPRLMTPAECRALAATAKEDAVATTHAMKEASAEVHHEGAVYNALAAGLKPKLGSETVAARRAALTKKIAEQQQKAETAALEGRSKTVGVTALKMKKIHEEALRKLNEKYPPVDENPVARSITSAV